MSKTTTIYLAARVELHECRHDASARGDRDTEISNTEMSLGECEKELERCK